MIATNVYAASSHHYFATRYLYQMSYRHCMQCQTIAAKSQMGSPLLCLNDSTHTFNSWTIRARWQNSLSNIPYVYCPIYYKASWSSYLLNLSVQYHGMCAVFKSEITFAVATQSSASFDSKTWWHSLQDLILMQPRYTVNKTESTVNSKAFTDHS